MKSLEKEIRITGLSINTTNENNQGMQDIGKLWQEFTKHPVFSKYVAEGCSIYTVYDQYETDETGKYRFTVGIKDLNLSEDFATATIQKEAITGLKFHQQPQKISANLGMQSGKIKVLTDLLQLISKFMRKKR